MNPSKINSKNSNTQTLKNTNSMSNKNEKKTNNVSTKAGKNNATITSGSTATNVGSRRPDPVGDYYQLHDPRTTNNLTIGKQTTNANTSSTTNNYKYNNTSADDDVRSRDSTMIMIDVYYDANDVDIGDDNNNNYISSEDWENDHPEYYMSKHTIEKLRTDSLLSEYDKMLIQRLACRKFHIPGKTFTEDYIYWFCNNHPFFSFCYADPKHPFGIRERTINLVSSLAFGLCATCCVVLWFYYQRDSVNFNTVLFSLNQYVDVTIGMVTLFAFSGPIHVLFDLGIFFLQACPPCRTGGVCETICGLPNWHQQIWIWLGTNLAFVVTVVSCLLGIKVMLMRASINETGSDTELANDIQNYSFLLLYLAEITIANFIAFPICTFIVFSGVLGCCGRIPGIGGRPYQVRKHERYMQEKRIERRKLFLQQQQQVQQHQQTLQKQTKVANI